MRFAALCVLVLGAVLVSPGVEGLPLLARRPFIGRSHEVLVPVPVLPARRVGELLPFIGFMFPILRPCYDTCNAIDNRQNIQ
jgi:hypothetical protein